MSETLYCRTTLNHLGAEAPVVVPVEIYDARLSPRVFSWSTNGFELIEFPSAVEDWSSSEVVEAVHYDEVTAWAKKFTGCDAVLFFPALLRNPQTAAERPDYAPIELAHSDYTEAYAAMIGDPDQAYHKVLQPAMVRAGVNARDIAACRRVLTLQLWRNTGAARPEFPLCFCDAATVPRQQLMSLRVEQYGGVETQFDAFGLLPPDPNIRNRWYTYPAMAQDEVVVFRAFDTDCVASHQPFWTPHCAFRDPHSDGTARSSVEMRAICLFSE